MNYTTTISAGELNNIVTDEKVRVFDCRFSLKDPQGGLKCYQQGHLPHAQFADMDTQLSSPMTESSGRHPLPSPEDFIQQLRAWGVSNDTQVIAYDDMKGAFAARLWWMMRWVGHEKVAVLDGGMEKWSEAGFPLTQDSVDFSVGDFSGDAKMEWLVDIGTVSRELEAGNITLIDARAADRFTAKDQQTDPVPGHIPGSKNLPFGGNLTDDGLMKPPSEIKQRFDQIIKENPDSEVVNMCGSGVTACHNLLAQAIAGMPPMKIFIGSWSQWIRDPARPVATGE